MKIQPIGPAEFNIDCPLCQSNGTVNINEFDTDIKKGQCYNAFSKAIKFSKSKSASLLCIPKGIYRFSTGDPLVFEGMADFVFDGGGSEFIFSDFKTPGNNLPEKTLQNKSFVSNISSFITIANCNRIVLRNFIIDWDWDKTPLASIGIIQSVSSDFTYFDLRFPEYDITHYNPGLLCFTPMDGNRFSPGCRNGMEFGSSFINKGYEKCDAHTIRVTTKEPGRMIFLKPGQVYLVRHFMYDAHGILMYDNSHLSLQNITCYSAPGHAFLSMGDQHHWELKGCKIKKKPGTARCISATADGHHISNSKGFCRMENCDFGFNGDDCLNIHDNAATNITQIDKHTMVLNNVWPWSACFYPGDLIEFRNSDLSPMNVSLKVENIKWTDKNKCQLSFCNCLPCNLKQNSILFNRRYNSGNYIVRNNYFHQNRARGVLAHAPDGIIEGNHFYMNQGPAIQMECGVGDSWSEGFGIKNVVIRNNYIDSCDVNHWSMAVIYLGVYLPEGRTEYPIFTDILYEMNTIVNCPQQAFFLSSCSNVLIKDNAIINPNSERSINGDEVYGYTVDAGLDFHGTIMITKASNISVWSNKRISLVQTFDNGIYAGKNTARINMYNNVGFGMHDTK